MCVDYFRTPLEQLKDTVRYVDLIALRTLIQSEFDKNLPHLASDFLEFLFDKCSKEIDNASKLLIHFVHEFEMIEKCSKKGHLVKTITYDYILALNYHS